MFCPEAAFLWLFFLELNFNLTLQGKKDFFLKFQNLRIISLYFSIYGVFTLADTDTGTDTDTDTDKMGLQPICICVGVVVGACVCVGQYEHLHTILFNPFFYRCQCRAVWTLH